MAKVLKIADFTVTTTSTVVVPTGVLPYASVKRGSDYILEVTATGAGSGWTPTVKWSSPGAVATTIGTFAAVTTNGTKAMTWVYAGTSNLGSPPVNQLNLAMTTAGTTSSLTGALYLITDGP